MVLPKSSRVKYQLLSRSEKDKNLSISLDTNPINREFFPNGALLEQDIPKMIERFVGGYEKCKTPIFMLFDSQDKFIGRAGFAYVDELKSIEIGYVIDYRYWGCGYATEVVKTLLEWGKENLNYNEVYAFATTNNLASLNVMKKAQMEYVGHRPFKGVECIFYKKAI